LLLTCAGVTDELLKIVVAALPEIADAQVNGPGAENQHNVHPVYEGLLSNFLH